MVGFGVDTLNFDLEESGAEWFKIDNAWTETTESLGQNVYTSANIDDSETSCMLTFVDVSTSSKIISFEWSVDSEDYYDYIRYYVDGEENAQLAGNLYPEFTTVTKFLPQTENTVHKLMVCFEKDHLISSGEDAGYMKNFQILDGLSGTCEDSALSIECFCKGTALDNGECACDESWSGNNCQFPICADGGCINGGTCEEVRERNTASEPFGRRAFSR